MYDDEPTEKKPLADLPQDGMGLRKSRRMIMGAVAFDVPTVEYVDSLEMRIVRQERTIAEQNRMLKRMEIALTTMRNLMRRQAGNLSELGYEINNKIDRRDI
ncbi:unnamed protein product [Sphagnum tenellum]